MQYEVAICSYCEEIIVVDLVETIEDTVTFRKIHDFQVVL
jgi:hypothetical protein